MVDVLKRYGIREKRLLAAMGKVRRHVFIPEQYRHHQLAYADRPYPIGIHQTISQPYIVAYMTDRLSVRPGARILEIGTGSGYQAAVLAELGAEVYSIEFHPDLAEHARRVLADEGYASRVTVILGDGHEGLPEHAPYDGIIGTCSPTEVPPKLIEQLKEDGCLIAPVGVPNAQELVIIKKVHGVIEQSPDLPVRFVPMLKRLR